jgi:hypothetical protein
MTNRLMMSVAAAALIAGTGFANAREPERNATRRRLNTLHLRPQLR